eukprot:Blabericola_migrator_1__5884@NODE_297_length_10209_cov_136_062907_g244_i0_p5_GENE_NODE_297_length_10209_cov_136_062907_g244_i0NODE_297_length_10209_cov_136_062907_g244_i0_p5_ORF_typecomplete_len332_score37_24AOX/PF01786_17/1_2e68COQ7/PF03232_13/0_0048_NODE_297_length_10209_cov_136_062907_g244_i064337428
MITLHSCPKINLVTASFIPLSSGRIFGRQLSLSAKPTARQFNALIPFTSLAPLHRRSVWTPSAAYIADLDGVCADSGARMPDAPHWRLTARGVPDKDFRMPHSVYTQEEVDGVEITHVQPQSFVDRAAYRTVWVLRRVYDLATGYTIGLRNEKCMIRRIVFLETVAGVPGMVAAAIRHLRSLRKMQRDYGWIHTLLEEAENERMHLMTALLLNNPGRITRMAVIGAQAGFLAWYTLMYLLSPTYCHRFVGYLEEEAVKTYTNIVELIDKGKLEGFKIVAPKASQVYYQLPEDAALRDVFLAMRADEAHHREVNHTFADMTPSTVNPFPPGY